jgi:hypothetical protein
LRIAGCGFGIEDSERCTLRLYAITKERWLYNLGNNLAVITPWSESTIRKPLGAKSLSFLAGQNLAILATFSARLRHCAQEIRKQNHRTASAVTLLMPNAFFTAS